MAKAGDPYQNIVAAIIQAFAPNAIVTQGEWVDGPDGIRDRDVTVRGNLNGRDVLALIECKDWKKPVPIKEVDALDSKRFDINADLSFICSNSGFTGPALRKAARKGISAITVVASGDERLRTSVHDEFFAKLSYIHQCHLTVIRENVDPNGILVNPDELYFQGIPATNWLADICDYILDTYPERAAIIIRYALKEETEFLLHGQPIRAIGLMVGIVYMRKWMRQLARLDASKGIYDYINQMLGVPPGEHVEIRLDDDKWKVIEGVYRLEELREVGPGEIIFTSHLIDSPLHPVDGIDVEPFHELIASELVMYEGTAH